MEDDRACLVAAGAVDGIDPGQQLEVQLPLSHIVLAAFATAKASKRPVAAACAAVSFCTSRVSSHETSVPQWSSNRSPTGSGWATGIRSSRSSASGPMPLRRRMAGKKYAPAARITLSPSNRRPSADITPVARPSASSTRSTSVSGSTVRLGRPRAASRYASAVLSASPHDVRRKRRDPDRSTRIIGIAERCKTDCPRGLDERSLEQRRGICVRGRCEKHRPCAFEVGP